LSEKITLKDLYEYTTVNFVLKTTNISKYRIEYINHISHPDLSVIDAIKMTTCVPLLFQPIKYNDDLYVDGGLCGNYPIEYNRTLKSKNYLGIHIKVKDKEKHVNDIFSYLNRLQMAPTSPYDCIYKKRKNTILIIVDELGTVFKKTYDENMKILINGYLSCETHFNPG
jgi:predicted acylesterase/phospholipase RssA